MVVPCIEAALRPLVTRRVLSTGLRPGGCMWAAAFDVVAVWVWPRATRQRPDRPWGRVRPPRHAGLWTAETSHQGVASVRGPTGGLTDRRNPLRASSTEQVTAGGVGEWLNIRFGTLAARRESEVDQSWCPRKRPVLETAQTGPRDRAGRADRGGAAPTAARLFPLIPSIEWQRRSPLRRDVIRRVGAGGLGGSSQLETSSPCPEPRTGRRARAVSHAPVIARPMS